jgi:hypothetical protein
MRISIRGWALLAGACVLTTVAASAQDRPLPAPTGGKVSADVAVVFVAERAELAPGQCCFWLKGGGVDAALNFPKGLGIAASVNGNYASGIAPGVNLEKMDFMAGPRYTYVARAGHAPAADRKVQLFGQGLFGGVHA